MNDRDYAIVVGVRRYPMFGKTERHDRNLGGPDLDAAGVYAWLTDPEKGGVPPENVTCIRSQEFPDPFENNFDAEPNVRTVTKAFDKLHSLAQSNDEAGKGRRIGRRLYLYASGHGYAKERGKGAVYMADATMERTHHFPLSAWAQWFVNSGYFEEVALWMDCCMIRDLSIDMLAAGYKQTFGAAARFFAAYSALPSQFSVERTFPNGECRGVFTYTLLRGLNGEAADPETKQITSQSLKSYLINAMSTFMDPKDLEVPDYSKSADCTPDDPMVFATVKAAPVHSVSLELPPNAIGQTVEVVTGSPVQVVTKFTADAATATFELPQGQYFARIGPLGWQQDILIAGGDRV